MPDDVTSLQIKVLSDGVSTASKRLDKLEKSGALAETRMDSTSRSATRMGRAFKTAGNVARGALTVIGLGAVGLTELCTGSGPVMVQVDDTGAPVGPPHFCPDYALTLLVDASAPQSLADPVWLQARLTGCFVPVVAETRVLTRACARAPPVGL